MCKCKFIALGNSRYYTTANELGHYLISRGHRFGSDKIGSYHFGSKFNKMLDNEIKRSIPNENLLKYSFENYKKLLYTDDMGIKVLENTPIFKMLKDLGMCEDSSISSKLTNNPESKATGLDLYDKFAVNAIIILCENPNIREIPSEDCEIVMSEVVPVFYEDTIRISAKGKKNSQRQLFPCC